MNLWGCGSGILWFWHILVSWDSLSSAYTNCIFLSCHVRVLEWFHTLWLPECQWTPCWKQARNLKLSDCSGTRTPNHLVWKQTHNHLAKLVKGLSFLVSTCLYSAFDLTLSSFLDCIFCIFESHWSQSTYSTKEKFFICDYVQFFIQFTDYN